jgi:hypothetical protein
MSHTLHYKVSILGALISSIAFTALAVFAIAPGETLDPVNTHTADCPNGPIDVTCIINPYEGLDLGSILFLDTAGDLNTSPDLFWDNVNGRIGIGTTAPDAQLDIATNSTTRSRIVLSTAVGSYFLNTFGGASTNKFSIGRISPAVDDFVLHNGNVGMGATAPTVNLQVDQPSTGVGTVSTPGNSTTLTGVGTQFRNTFKVGDTITVAGETSRTIATITSNTVLDTTVAFSATPRVDVAYTLTGGNRFSVLGNGNVGIGTTTLNQKLEVADVARFTIPTHPNSYTDIRGGESINIYRSSTEGVGDPGLYIHSNQDQVSFMAWDDELIRGLQLGVSSVAPGVEKISIYSGTTIGRNYIAHVPPVGGLLVQGNVGIGTTTPNQGIVEVKGGTVCVDTNSDDDASSCITTESDRRIKNIIGDTEYGIDDLMDVQVYDFSYITDPLSRTRTGVIAQELYDIFPDVVEKGDNGETLSDDSIVWTVDYSRLSPMIIRAVQDLHIQLQSIENSFSEQNSFVDNIIAWLGDMTNGIQNIFTKRITTEELCVEDICVTRDQFLQMIENSNTSFDQNPIEEEPVVEENNETDLLEDEEIEIIVDENETDQDEEIVVDEESPELDQESQEEEIQNNPEENPSDVVEGETLGSPQE